MNKQLLFDISEGIEIFFCNCRFELSNIIDKIKNS